MSNHALSDLFIKLDNSISVSDDEDISDLAV